MPIFAVVSNELKLSAASDYQNELHNRAAYVIELPSGYFKTRRGVCTFSRRVDAEDYVLNMISALGGVWLKASIVALAVSQS